jgi:hypothetical protein
MKAIIITDNQLNKILINEVKTVEEIRKLASQYSSLKELREKDRRLYHSIIVLGLGRPLKYNFFPDGIHKKKFLV